jgi:hypothetical protein
VSAWEQMQRDIDELKTRMNGKIDCEMFDSEIQMIKDLINQLASSGKEITAPIISSGPSISTKELNDLR